MIDEPVSQQPKASSFESLFTIFTKWRNGTLGEILDDWRWIFTYLWVMVLVMVGSSLFGLVIGNVLGRVTLKLQIHINNDIQGDIFDKIIDADWMAINRYSKMC